MAAAAILNLLVWPTMLVSMNIYVDIWVNQHDFNVFFYDLNFIRLRNCIQISPNNHIEENVIDTCSLASVLLNNIYIGPFGFIFNICFIIQNYI